MLFKRGRKSLETDVVYGTLSEDQMTRYRALLTRQQALKSMMDDLYSLQTELTAVMEDFMEDIRQTFAVPDGVNVAFMPNGEVRRYRSE